jgi:formylglycine-generating enzyme
MALRTLLSYGLASMLVACSEAPSSMVAVPAGTIMMGCNEPLDMLCRGDELPYHAVSLDRFEIDETEVTQGAYEECADAGACSIPPRGYDPAATPDLPVVHVDWDDADAYCHWSRKRLPT